VSYQFIKDTTPTARKDHYCGLCGLMILKGEKHVKRVGVGEGGFGDFRMHTECEVVTHTWSYDCWESLDEYEFRDEKKAFYERIRNVTEMAV